MSSAEIWGPGVAAAVAIAIGATIGASWWVQFVLMFLAVAPTTRFLNRRERRRSDEELRRVLDENPFIQS